MQLVIFSIIILIDRLSVGRVGHDIDNWVSSNLWVLLFEIIFRYLTNHCVSSLNFDRIQKLDWCVQFLIHAFTVWGIYLMFSISDA